MFKINILVVRQTIKDGNPWSKRIKRQKGGGWDVGHSRWSRFCKSKSHWGSCAAVILSSVRLEGEALARDDWWGVPLTAPSFRAYNRYRENARTERQICCVVSCRWSGLTRSHSRCLYASERGGQTTAFRVSGLYKRPTNNFQWEVGITRAHFQPQTQVRALLCVSADAFVIRICVFTNAGDAQGWGSERMVLTHKWRCYCLFSVTVNPSEVYLFIIPHWWWVCWTPACQYSVTNGRCVYWFVPIRVMPCAALRCTSERESERKMEKPWE